MDVSPRAELEQFITSKVEAGLYQSSSEVVLDALRLFKLRDEDMLERLRRDVRSGFEAVDASDFETHEEISTKNLASDIKDRGRARLANSSTRK